MQYLIIVLLISCCLIYFLYFQNADKKKEAHTKAAEEPAPIEHKKTTASESSGRIKVSNNVAKDKNTSSGTVTSRKSLDEIYAESNNMWVCRHCETLNSYEIQECAACGAKR